MVAALSPALSRPSQEDYGLISLPYRLILTCSFPSTSISISISISSSFLVVEFVLLSSSVETENPGGSRRSELGLSDELTDTDGCNDSKQQQKKKISAGCKAEIGHKRFLSCVGGVWHPECFRCVACDVPIIDYQFSVSGNRPYHKSCYKAMHHPKFNVCQNHGRSLCEKVKEILMKESNVQGLGPYSNRIKKAEKEIQETTKKLKDLCGCKVHNYNQPKYRRCQICD